MPRAYTAARLGGDWSTSRISSCHPRRATRQRPRARRPPCPSRSRLRPALPAETSSSFEQCSSPGIGSPPSFRWTGVGRSRRACAPSTCGYRVNDGLLLRGLGHFDWVVRNAQNVQRMCPTHTIDSALPPRLVLLAPQFSAVLRRVMRQFTHPHIQWVRYHTVDTPGGVGILFESVSGRSQLDSHPAVVQFEGLSKA